ncbi:MAG: DedA family protein, partial [Thermoproteota archaeon]|nr:DedA family protein [Thermoproteota archaeon]
IGMAITGALGTTFGGIIIYIIALKAGKSAIIKFGKHLKISESSIQKSEVWFERYGKLAVFLGRMAPGVREIISIPAGIGRMNIVNFIVFTFLGSVLWSIGLTLVGYYGGQAWEKYFQQLSYFFSIALVLVVVGFLVHLVLNIPVKREKISKSSPCIEKFVFFIKVCQPAIRHVNCTY